MLFVSLYKKSLTSFLVVICSVILIGCVNISYSGQLANVAEQYTKLAQSPKNNKFNGLSLTGEQLQILLWVNFKHPDGLIINQGSSDTDSELLTLAMKIYDNIARTYVDDYFSAMRAVEIATFLQNKDIALKNAIRYINRTKPADESEEVKNRYFKANFYGVLLGMIFLDKKILLDATQNITDINADLRGQEQQVADLFANTSHSFQQKIDFINVLYEDSTNSLWLDVLVASVDTGKHIIQLKTLLEKYPENPKLRLELAQYYEQSNDINKAIENYVYLDNLPKKEMDIEVTTHRQLAIHYVTVGNFHGALKHLKWLKLYVPKYRDWAYFYAGILSFQKKQYRVAIRNFEQITTESGYKNRSIFYQAHSYFDLKEYSEARNYLHDLRLKVGDDLYQRLGFFSEILILESNILVDTKRHNQAYKLLEGELKRFRLDPSVRYHLAILYAKQENFNLAEQHLQILRKSGAGTAEVLNTLGYILTDKLKRHREALPLLLKAHKLAPNRSHILDSLGWVYFNLKKYGKASKYLQKSLQLHYEPEVISHYVQLLWKTGNFREAKLLLSRGLKMFPESKLLKEIKFNSHSSVLNAPR